MVTEIAGLEVEKLSATHSRKGTITKRIASLNKRLDKLKED